MVDKLLSPNISISSSNSSKYVLQFPLLLPFLNIENEIPLTLFPQECVDWILYNIAIYLNQFLLIAYRALTIVYVHFQ
jgi:hypothetical protein